jgi:hypothetical protein
MASKTTFFTSEYGERVLVRRVFLSPELSKEAIVLYTQLLNDFPMYSLKKSLSQLAGASLKFRSYFYEDGYVLEGRLSQSQSSALHYLFSNPYKDGEQILNDVFSLGYEKGEKNIAVSKERILANSYVSLRSSLSVGKMMISASYAPLCFDEKKIKSVTEADLDKVAKAASALNRGDAFYFGAMDKSALSLTADYQQDLVLSKASFTTNEIKLDYLDDETAMFIFEHTKVESKQEKTVLETAFAGMISYLKDYLKKKVFIDYEMEYAMLDDSHTMLSITTFKGRLDSILHQLPLSVGEGISFDLTPSYDAAIRENMMKEIALKMSFSKVIEDELLMKDIALKDHETVLSRASYRDFINTIVVEDLLLVRKEQDHA